MGFMILLSMMHVIYEKTPWAYTVGEGDTNGTTLRRSAHQGYEVKTDDDKVEEVG